MQQKLIAVVPTFHPPDRVVDLVRGLAQHCHVLISDDASPCTSDPVLLKVKKIPRVHMIRHQKNAGIARALNDGLRFAEQYRASWLLTVDQDTILPHDYVEQMLDSADTMDAEDTRVGVIGAEFIEDAAGLMTYPLTRSGTRLITEEVIQTGSLWSVMALANIGGFDESLAIDAVDAAACLGLRENEYHVCVAPQQRVRHHLGHAKVLRIFGKEVMVTGHQPDRRTSMLRNRIHLFPRELRQSPKHAFRTLRRIGANHFLGLLTETNRMAKLKGSLRGLSRSPLDDS